MENGRQSQMGLSLKSMLLVIGPSLQCFLSSRMYFIMLMAGCHELLRGKSCVSVKVTKVPPKLIGWIKFSHSRPCNVSWAK
jgi:hypothetical protein